MRRMATTVFLGLFLLLSMCRAQAAPGKVEYLETKPLSKVVTARLKPVETGSKLVYIITWGGDVSLVYGAQEGLFREAGLDVALTLENDFAKQVQAVLDGKTPYLRGTMGMINAAAEVFKAAGTDLVVIVQLTWSTGGDTMTVRPSIRTPNDLKGKTIAQAMAIKNTDIVEELSLPPIKIHCSVLAEDAIKAAIGDYLKKNNEENSASSQGVK